MINPQLTEYIQQQIANGFRVEEIKKRLLESGWEPEDIETGFNTIKTESKPVYTAAESAVQETPVVTEAVSIPEIKPEAVSVTPEAAESPAPEQYQPEQPIIGEAKKGPRTGLILVIIAILAGFLGIGTWLIYQNFSKNMFASKTKEGTVINPFAEVSATATPFPVISPEVTEKPSGPQPYINATYGFSILSPEGWKNEENATTGVIVNIVNPTPDADNNNRFATNINIVSESTGNLTLSDYVTMSKKVLNESFTNYTTLSENTVDVNGKSATLIEATYEMGVYQLHNLQMFIINSGKSYVVTATTLNSVWNNYKDVFNSSLMSFALK